MTEGKEADKQKDLENSELLIEAQKIIDQLAKKYPIPKEKIDRARKVKVLVLNEENLAKKMMDWINYSGIIDFDAQKKEKIFNDTFTAVNLDLKISATDIQKLIQAHQLAKISKEVKSIGGVNLPFADHDKILVNAEILNEKLNKQAILRHELIHVLSDNGLKSSSGIYGDSVYDLHNQLNEGATQLLELFARCETNELELQQKIQSGEIITPYEAQVRALLLLMNKTNHGDGVKVGVEKLASKYFNNVDGQGEYSFMFDLASNLIDDGNKDKYLALLYKLYE